MECTEETHSNSDISRSSATFCTCELIQRENRDTKISNRSVSTSCWIETNKMPSDIVNRAPTEHKTHFRHWRKKIVDFCLAVMGLLFDSYHFKCLLVFDRLFCQSIWFGFLLERLRKGFCKTSNGNKIFDKNRTKTTELCFRFLVSFYFG